MMKGSVQQKDRTLANICEPNKAALKHIRQILTNLKEENTQRFSKSKRLELPTLINGQLDYPDRKSIKHWAYTCNRWTYKDIRKMFHSKQGNIHSSPALGIILQGRSYGRPQKSLNYF